MIYIDVDTRLRELNKSAYWLANEMKCSHGYISKMRNSGLKGIGFDMLELLCRVLECNVSDIIKIKQNGNRRMSLSGDNSKPKRSGTRNQQA